MKVHLIKQLSIDSFVLGNARSHSSFTQWLAIVKHADWNQPEDIIKTFNSADILGRDSNRVIFNIGGNNYRMICKYLFGKHQVHLFVCWIGTHAEYDKICKSGTQFTINNY